MEDIIGSTDKNEMWTLDSTDKNEIWTVHKSTVSMLDLLKLITAVVI